MLDAILRTLGEALFPARCVGCHRRGTPLCDECRAHLPYLPGGVCVRCAGTLGPRGTCRGCRQLSPAVSTVHAPFAYQGAARTAVLTLKFKSGRYLIPLMGELLCEALETHPLQSDLVVPVPLSAARLRQRGFNQAALLAERVAPGLHAVVTGALVREERAAQVGLGAAERLTNLAGAFTCADPAGVAGKRVVLVDDVVTTGATVSMCADTLAQAGASRVMVLAFARDL
jgi:ComF family protein